MKVTTDDMAEEIDIVEEIINGIPCAGFGVVYLTPDACLLQVDELGISTYPSKKNIIDGLNEELAKYENNEAVIRKDLNTLHPIIIHMPMNEVIQQLFPSYLRPTFQRIDAEIFRVICYIADKEMVMKLKALDLRDDIIASIDLEKQDGLSGKGLMEAATGALGF